MFDHLKFGVSDYAASKAFFLKALEPLGVAVVQEGPPTYGVELSSKSKASLCLYQTEEKPAHLHLGGDHRGPWPADVLKFLTQFVPLQQPPNYQLVADELARRFDFVRALSTVAAYVQAHLGPLIPKPEAAPRPRRRWQRAHLGELWQHDSSIHTWWPNVDKPVLLLTIDDHSRKIVDGRFVSADTTWSHFQHFRTAFETHGVPAAIYTDALSLFGHTPTSDSLDPCSQFQRALTALGVAHLVAPSPQAKGKIERRFGTFQSRLVTLLSYEGVTDYGPANELLRMEIHRHNTSLCRTTGLRPDDAWTQALAQKRSRMRPTPQRPLTRFALGSSGYPVRKMKSDSAPLPARA